MPYPIAEHKTKIHADLGDFQFDHLFNFVGFCCCCPWNSWSDGSQPIQLQSQGLVFFGWEKIGLLHPDRAQKPRKKPFWRWWKLAYEMLKIRLLFQKEQSSISVMFSIYVNPPLQQTTTNNQQRKSATEFEILNKKNAQNRDLPLAICQRFIWQMHQHLGKNTADSWKIPWESFGRSQKNGFRLGLFSTWSFWDVIEISMIYGDFMEFMVMLMCDVWWFVIIYGHSGLLALHISTLTFLIVVLHVIKRHRNT